MFRLYDSVVRPADASDGFHEHDRFGRHGQPGLPRVIRIVEADGDELTDSDIRYADPRLSFHKRQRFRPDRREHLQTKGGYLVRAEFAHDLREVAQTPIAIDEPGSF